MEEEAEEAVVVVAEEYGEVKVRYVKLPEWKVMFKLSAITTRGRHREVKDWEAVGWGPLLCVFLIPTPHYHYSSSSSSSSSSGRGSG